MQILRSWWGMVLLAVIVACSGFLFYTLTVEESVDAVCTLIYEGKEEEAKAKIDTIKDIDAIGSNKETMLMAACRVGNINIIEYLVNKNANANKCPPGALTPLELYCEYGYEAGAKGAELLCDNGANPKEYSFKEPLFLMAEKFQWMTKEQRNKATEVAVELIKNGASLYDDETTILHLCAEADMYILFYNIVRSNEGTWLMDSKDNRGMTPYEVAAKHGSVNVQRAFKQRIDEIYIAQGMQPPDVLASNGLGPDGFLDIDSFLNQYLQPDSPSTPGMDNPSTPNDDFNWNDNGIIYLPEGETWPEEE